MRNRAVPARLIALSVALTAASATAPAVAEAATPVHAAASPARAVSSSPSGTALSASDQVVSDNLTLRSTLKGLGPDLAGLVTDAETGQVLWSNTPLEHQLPASNAKLVTAVNALSTFGPAHRITTKVVQGTAPRRLVLVGGGDPSLSRAHLTALAKEVTPKVRAKGLRTVRVLVDDSLFPAPSNPVGWQRGYVHEDVRAVRALVVNQHDVADTSINAGRVFANR